MTEIDDMTGQPTPISTLHKESPYMIRENGLGGALRHFRSTSSTNEEARAWARAGAKHGSVVVADFQSAGRGRFDRVWESASDQNLLLTVVLRLNLPRPALLPLAIGVGVLRCLKKLSAPLNVEVKWPNDVLIDSRKCAGILVESPEDGLFLVGIGLNVNQDSFPEHLTGEPTSLLLEAGRRFDRREVYSVLLRELDQVLLDLPGPEFIGQYSAHLAGIGTEISISDGKTGMFEGVNEEGALLLETNHGREVYFAGDISLRNHHS